LNPFYIFQAFAVVSWFLVWYYIYALVVIFMSTITALRNFFQTRKNMIKLRELAKHSCEVNRLTDGVFQRVRSDLLVPGDIIEVERMKLPCDMILLSGECVVNESMLTGESVPVIKSGIPKNSEEIYDIEQHQTNTLFAGTEVIQLKPNKTTKIQALCVRTGFDTSKGKLVLSILFPRPTQFKYYRDSIRFLTLLFAISFIGIAYSSVRWVIMDVPLYEFILRCMNHVTVAVPPALPLAITVCISFAMDRLQQKKIFTTSPLCVNTAGQVDCMCFDKTGTLTSEGLDLKGVRPVISNTFSDMIDSNSLEQLCSNRSGEASALNSQLLFLQSMATAHSLVTIDNQLVGDPLELEVFKATHSALEEVSEEDNEYNTSTIVNLQIREAATDNVYHESHLELGRVDRIAILKRFEFSSHRKRMSVLVRNLSMKQSYAFIKGSPEHILSLLSDKKSTPYDFKDVLKSYTHKGYRVIAYAYKPLPDSTDINSYTREDVEKNLTLLGLVVMCNKMKSQTTSVIRDLRKAKILNIMVTGDNVLTAISVARKCGISDRTKRLFLGEFSSDNINDGELTTAMIEWADVDQSESKLLENLMVCTILSIHIINNLFIEASLRSTRGL
jgi:cation-transporting ATPase 13A2